MGGLAHGAVAAWLALSMCLILMPFSADAQSWRTLGTIGGFYVDGAPNGMFLRCAGPRVSVNFSGFSQRLPEGATYRVGVSVDGLARILSTKSFRVRGNSVLVHEDSLSNLEGLIADLKKGESVEISSPAGRYVIPLKGSGAALEALVRRCGQS
ncbi:hypothetical protein [Fulvimarina sp. 2208YS6-2-32]|nr:hypothetical protein [Fulvimarina sp. 2208YS6-2-32]